MDDFQKSEGIILRVIPYRDYDHIFTLFTPFAGVMKLIFHGSRSKKKGGQGLCMPMTKVEVVYREKNGEIFQCREMALIEPYAHLRSELKLLETACDFLQVISATQMAGKPAPRLYQLLCQFLDNLPAAPFPSTLAICFRLKLLKHEGLAAFPLACAHCGQLLVTEAYVFDAESWCKIHRPPGGTIWAVQCLEQLYLMTESLSLREICASEVSDDLRVQSIRFFEACLTT